MGCFSHFAGYAAFAAGHDDSQYQAPLARLFTDITHGETCLARRQRAGDHLRFDYAQVLWVADLADNNSDIIQLHYHTAPSP